MIKLAIACVYVILGSHTVSSEDYGPLISFDKGRIGVNLFGFHASAGLGSLLTGNSEDGGLFADAGTPFGQYASAGIGGKAEKNGRSSEGGLFAGATAGLGLSAQAGLGRADNNGKPYASASHPAVKYSASATLSSDSQTVAKKKEDVEGTNTYIQKVALTSNPKEDIVYSSKYITSASSENKETVEKNAAIDVRKEVVIADATPPQPPILLPQAPVYIEKTKFKSRRRGPGIRKHIFITRGGYIDEGLPPPPPPVEVGIAPPAFQGSVVTKTVARVNKPFNPQLVNDVFNIPISTLTAVSNLVGGIAKGVDGSVSATKTITINKTKH